MTKPKLIPVGYPKLIEPGMLFVVEAPFRVPLYSTEIVDEFHRKLRVPDGYCIPILNALNGHLMASPGTTFLVLDILTPITRLEVENYNPDNLPRHVKTLARWTPSQDSDQ